jgi:hypothetical protein
VDSADCGDPEGDGKADGQNLCRTQTRFFLSLPHTKTPHGDEVVRTPTLRSAQGPRPRRCRSRLQAGRARKFTGRATTVALMMGRQRSNAGPPSVRDARSRDIAAGRLERESSRAARPLRHRHDSPERHRGCVQSDRRRSAWRGDFPCLETPMGTPDSRRRTVLTSFEPHRGGTQQRNSIGSQPDTSSGRQFASSDHWTPPTLRGTPQRHARLKQAVMARRRGARRRAPRRRLRASCRRSARRGENR